MYEKLPNDPFMLMSAVNMLLRDKYDTLGSLCCDCDLDEKELKAKLLLAGFEYNEEQRKFW